MTRSTQFEISHRPDFAQLAVNLQQGEKIYAEPSAMVSMDGKTIDLKAGLKGGLLKAVGPRTGW